MADPDPFQRPILTVGELTRQLADLVENTFGSVWVAGEISTLRRPASGHYYFILKDESAQLKAVLFRPQQKYLSFAPADGQEVLVRGRLALYGPRGEYQIVIDYMEPRGQGALRLAFEKMKAVLAAEGLFDEARKKRLPFLPRRVALVTSPTGAALRDFVRVARRRFENVHLSVYPVRVQGEGSADQIAQAVVELNELGGFDVIVLTRGGGSIEDLWAFNEEVVARAVAASAIPVVSAVGHEIDFTIADFAADLRAPTPSAAAEMIFREKGAIEAHLSSIEGRFKSGLKSRAAFFRERLAHLATRLGDPGRRVTEQRLRLDQLSEELVRAVRESLRDQRGQVTDTVGRLNAQDPRLRLVRIRDQWRELEKRLERSPGRGQDLRRHRLSALAGRLSSLSPLAVLERGYALVHREPDHRTVRSADDVAVGDVLSILLGRGELAARVQSTTKPPAKPSNS